MQNLKLFIFDIDNTITTGKSIWELMHQECNTWESQGLLYLNQFKSGEIDFDKFAQLDAASWKGLPKQETLEKAIAKIEYTPGFTELMDTLTKLNIKSAFISGSIGQFADYLAEKHNIHYVHANHLGLDEQNLFTGEINLAVPAHAKGELAQSLANELGLNFDEIAIIGDSHFDVPMLRLTKNSFSVRNQQIIDHVGYVVDDFYALQSILSGT